MAGIGEAAVGGVVGEATKSLSAKIKQNLGYVYHYHDNLKALQEADGQLVAKMSDERKFSGETSRGLREVGAIVENWRSNSEEVHQKADKLISRNYMSRLNPLSRYSTSRHASKLTPIIREKVQSAPDFGICFDRPIREGAKFNLGGYMEFDSRLRIQNAVLDALRNDNVSMCSICGMGGTGKTMMAKKIVQIVEADHLFDKVAMVTVSQNPNLEEIQKGIIESLELKIDDVSMQGRARKLNDWLLNNKSLLVLDDVWWQLHAENFEAIGVPLGTKVCKIFITSRNLDECRKMGSEPNILEGLDDGEAWDLFRQNAGQCIEEGNLRDTARNIVAECKGLPIAIATIATTLKGNPLGAWNDSLNKLKKSNLSEIPDMEKVYSKIQVSYDLLNNPEAQSCLLLCCLFPEDYDVPIEKLVFYGKGLELFEGVERLKEARDRVDSIVHKLKSSFLLLDGYADGFVKLHDIVRDFAVWISSKDENPYLIRCEEKMEKWPESCQYEKCSAISFVCRMIKNHPVGLRCPSLKLLHLDFCKDEIPKGFFEGMEELRVVDLEVFKLSALTMPKALKTLLVRHLGMGGCSNYVKEMLGKDSLKNLEIFSLPRTILSEFPEEIGLMRNLRCLRFGEGFIKNIPRGVLSNLVKLEELELPLNFSDWGLNNNASLDEIGSLPLTSITIGLQKGSVFPENIVQSITRFWIHIGRHERFDKYSLNSNVLVVEKVDACDALVRWTSNILLRKCQKLVLDRVDLKYIMSQQLQGNNCYPTEYFSQLTSLKIRDMGGLEAILHGTYSANRQLRCFSNLTEIEIQMCPKLKRAFPLSVAQELTQLKYMILSDCREMEEVFYDDKRDSGNQVIKSSVILDATSKGKQPKHIPTDQVASSVRLNNTTVEKSSISCPTPTSFIQCLLQKGKQLPKHLPSHQIIEENVGKVDEREVDRVIVWPRLKELKLLEMPKLRVMYNGNDSIECPSLEELTIRDCNIMEGLSYGSFIAPNFKYLDLQETTDIPKWLNLEQDSGILLKELGIYNCNEMLSLSLLKTLLCTLEELCIGNMDSLAEIWPRNTCFAHLTNINIWDCPKLKHVFPLSVATELTQLQKLRIDSCEEMEEIFYQDQVADVNQKATSVELNSPTASAPPYSFVPPHQKTVKQNATEKEVDDAMIDATILPQLQLLILDELTRFRIFYDGDHAIKLPSLKELRITGCGKMEALSNGSFKAPKLEYVTINATTEYLSASEDLNTTVTKMLNIVKEEEKDKDGDENEDTANDSTKTDIHNTAN